MKKKKKIVIIIASVIAAYLLNIFLNYYGDWLWFDNLKYASVFNTMLITKITTFISFFLIFILFFGLNLRMAHKRGTPARSAFYPQADDPRLSFLKIYKNKAIFWTWTVVALILGIIMSSNSIIHWNDFLQFIHASSFGINEPIFGKDAGFYVFKLPVFQFLINWYLFMVIITFIAVLISYYLDDAFVTTEKGFRLSKSVRRHLFILIAFFVLGISAHYLLKLYNVLYSSNGAAYGPSYMDVHAQIPAYWIIFIMSIGITLALFLSPIFKKKKVLLYASGVWLIVLITFVWIYPRVIEQFIVKPNELEKETPYILNNIKFTRQAYGLIKLSQNLFLSMKNSPIKTLKKINSPSITYDYGIVDL